ncbi:hypothetical protein [Legionella cardiaca]|uniref:Uncharacterized protein n=1 Tax=Legionella cardiaca TaxID=1071983 RepID=A0ABY8AQU5_9GAMM|nr:hypothetical protein [Legionella cardiaca]WED42596.1 hypothetical protein PXX05_11850 [Legionella cardiaca]
MANENLVGKALKLIWDEGHGFYNTYVPGFFAPYSNAKDVGLSLTAPLYAPFLLGVLTGVIAGITVLAALISIASYVTLGGAKLLGKHSVARTAYDVGLFCATVSTVGAILLPCCAFLTLISLPAAIAHIFTRTGASMGAGCHSCSGPETTHEETMTPSHS